MRQKLPYLAILIIYALMCLWVFGPVVLDKLTLVSTDGCPYYGPRHPLETVQAYAGSWSPLLLGAKGGVLLFFPQQLLVFFTSTLGCHNGLYMLNLLLAAFGSYCLGRALRVSRPAAVVASLGFAFSGYYLTLISAGHRGILSSVPWALLMLAALIRGLDRISPLHLCLAALCATFGVNAQADVMGLFILTAGIFAFYRIVRDHLVRPVPAGQTRGRQWLRLTWSVLMAGCVLVATAMPFLAQFRGTIMPGRQQQLAKTGDDPEVFCTNWSLPPSEVAEFWAPNVFGLDTGNAETPYWGSLGRSLGWQPDGKQGGPGFRNLRQHNVYPGAVGLCFACVAVAGLFVSRRRRTGGGIENATEPQRSDAIFWTAAFAVLMILSFGRYTPVYHWFYRLVPMADTIRCPVKFIHLAVMALYILAGMGFDRWLSSVRSPTGGNPTARPGWYGLGYSAAVSVVLLATWVGIQGNQGGLANHWTQLGFAEPGIRARLFVGLNGALRHGIAIHAALAAMFAYFIFRRPSGKTRSVKGGLILVSALAILQGLDQGTAGRPYLHTADVSGWYDNPVAHRMKLESPHTRAWWTYTPWSTSFFFGWNSFFSQGIVFASPRNQDVLDDDYRAFYQRLSGLSPERLWQMTSCGYIIAPTKQIAPLLKSKPDVLQVFAALQLDTQRQRWIEAEAQTDSNFLVLKYRDALPRASVYYGIETVERREQALDRLARSDFNPRQSLVLTADAGVTARSSTVPSTVATIRKLDYTRVFIEADAAEDGVLLLTDRFDPGWTVRVDGKPAQPLQCNYMQRGVRVSKGRHTVEWTFRPHMMSAAIQGVAILAVLCAGAIAAVASRRRNT